MGFDVLSFFIGLIIGIVIIILIVWLMYALKLGFFAFCSGSSPVCKNAQYINDPGVAITDGYPASDTLTVIDGELNYKRPTKEQCTPGANQVVIIPFPQYCQFSTGSTLYESRIQGHVGDGQATYQATESSNMFTASANCTPLVGATTGVPLPMWDASNLS